MNFAVINDLSSPSTLTEAQQKRAKALKTARMFETLFAKQMVAQMTKSSITGEEGGFFGKDIGSSTYASWFEDQLAIKLAAGRGLGIGSNVMRYLENASRGETRIPTEAEAYPEKAAIENEIINKIKRERI